MTGRTVESPVPVSPAVAAPPTGTTAAGAAPSATDHWLMHVPVPLFAVVMGVTGLGIAWRKAAATLGAPGVVGEAILGLAATLFIAIACLYGIKMLRHPGEVRKEFGHPIRANFFPAISIGMLLLSIGAVPYGHGLATAVWGIGAAMHLTLTLHLAGRWLTKPFQITHSNPAWFIPVVGNILVPLTGVRLGYIEISWFFFAIGAVFWLVLFTVVFYRIVFHDQLPVKIVPTLFILIAPPAVGYLSYVALTGGVQVDAFARVLIYVALFLTLLLFSMVRTFLAVPFAVSWWAYTFPLDAITVATLEHAHLIEAPALAALGGVLLAVASGVVALVLVRTLRALTTGALFVPE